MIRPGSESLCDRVKTTADVFARPRPRPGPGHGSVGGGGEDENGKEDEDEDEDDWRTEMRMLKEKDDRFELLIVPNPEEDTIQHMTYVNNIWTVQGGTHYEHILAQLAQGVRKAIQEDKKLNGTHSHSRSSFLSRVCRSSLC